MLVNAAPVIHARTKDVDFRANLLVVPEDFSDFEVKWARKHISDSTRYFEMVNDSGRNVVFCSKRIIVVGISIRIEDLYRICGYKASEYGRVDGNRINYAFIGFALKKDSLRNAVDIPYSAFLKQYEKFMKLRWNDSNSPESLKNTKAAYEDFDFNAAVFDEHIVNDMSERTKYAIDSAIAAPSVFVAQATYVGLHKSKFAFCSDAPTANWVMDSDFDVVTSAYAKSINTNIAGQNGKDDEAIKNGSVPFSGTEKMRKQTDIDVIKNISVENMQRNRKEEKKNLSPLVVGLLIIIAIIICMIKLAK